MVADNASAIIWLGVLRDRIREDKPRSVPSASWAASSRAWFQTARASLVR